MSKKKRDHAWGENGFEDWVSKREYQHLILYLSTYIN